MLLYITLAVNDEGIQRGDVVKLSKHALLK